MCIQAGTGLASPPLLRCAVTTSWTGKTGESIRGGCHYGLISGVTSVWCLQRHPEQQMSFLALGSKKKKKRLRFGCKSVSFL